MGAIGTLAYTCKEDRLKGDRIIPASETRTLIGGRDTHDVDIGTFETRCCGEYGSGARVRLAAWVRDTVLEVLLSRKTWVKQSRGANVHPQRTHKRVIHPSLDR